MKTNTTNVIEEPVKLPPLIKKSASYKLIVPAKVEEKIRYLQRKFPFTEWSGVLFTTHEGSFENNDLVVTCQDIYPMDLGTSTFTQYNMDETVAGYIADNIELFECDIHMIHSHNKMAAFLSGTDLDNLRQEGAEKNCYVSLVVNNTGPYCAAITRRVKTKTEVTTKQLGSSYEFFGEGAITTEEDTMSESTKIIEEDVIEYYMMDVEREIVNNPLEYLDSRFDEIEQKKAETNKKSTSSWSANPIWYNKINEDTSFNDWMKDKYSEPKVKEQYLFDDETMKEMETLPTIDISKEKIHKCICQMLTCSLIVNPDMLNIDSWIKNHMKSKCNELFIDKGKFNEWAEFIVEFLIEKYCLSILDVPYDYDIQQSIVAQAMYEELSLYADSNQYINDYLEIINRYIEQ